MLAVKGIYENGRVRLLELVAVSEPHMMQATFLKGGESEEGLTPAQRSALAIIGL